MEGGEIEGEVNGWMEDEGRWMEGGMDEVMDGWVKRGGIDGRKEETERAWIEGGGLEGRMHEGRMN